MGQSTENVSTSTSDKVAAALKGDDLSAARSQINDLFRTENPVADLGSMTNRMVQAGYLNDLTIDDASMFAGAKRNELQQFVENSPPTADSLVALSMWHSFANIDTNGNRTLEEQEIKDYAENDKAQPHFDPQATSDAPVSTEVEQTFDQNGGNPNGSTNQADLVKVLENPDAPAAQKLGAVQQLAGLGLTEIALTDSDGTIVNCRIDVNPIANSDRNCVQLFAENVGGRNERILLRGIENKGEFSQEIGKNGAVGFTGDWWSQNHPDSALDAQ